MSDTTTGEPRGAAAPRTDEELAPPAAHGKSPARPTTVVQADDGREGPEWFRELHEAYSGCEPDMPSDEEIDRLIEEIQGRFDADQAAALVAACRDSVVGNIIEPFGLRGVFANRDRDGGRVVTRHNMKRVREGATDVHVPEDAKYGNSKQDYALKNRVREQQVMGNAVGAGNVKDDYTGEPIPANQAELDHVVSKRAFHDAGGFMQGKSRRSAFANDEENLAVTDRVNNRSKGNDSIADLKERKPEVDRRRTRPIEKRAEEAVSRHRPSKAQAAGYYGKKVAFEAVESGLRLGVRQALGLCLHELTVGIFDEVTDICRNGLREDESSYAHAVEKRLAEVWRRVQATWQEVLVAFRDGFLAGACSEVVTLLVNLWRTTSKRVVRIIREGALSFLRAFKMIVWLPEGMTRSEALDAAAKVMAGAILTACGIALEELIEKALGAVPFAELVVPVVLGMLVGLATAAVVFCLDQLDLFGVQEKRRREFLFAELDARVEQALEAAESAWGESLLSP